MNPCRRSVLITVAGGAAATTLAACGGEDSASSAGAGSGPAKGRIRFSSHITGMDQVVKKFNASQSDITVVFEQVPSPNEGGNSKLSNGIKAGNAPDLATVEYQDLPSFVSQDGLQPVGEIAKGVLAKMPEGITSSVTFADETWAVPYDAAPLVFYYRHDVFTSAGITVPKTWAEFEKAAMRIRSKRPKSYLTSFWPNEAKLFAGLSWQGGGQWFTAEDDSWTVSMTDPGTTAVASMWQRLVDDKRVLITEGFSDRWANNLDGGVEVALIGAPWSAAGLAERTASSSGKWRVAPLPAWKSPGTGMFGGSTFVVTKNSKNAKAAAKFAAWLASSPEAFKARGDAGVSYPAVSSLVPTAKAAVSTDHFGGQDIYAVFDRAGKSVREGWTWGPTLSTLTTLSDRFGSVSGGGKILQALRASQTATVSELKKAGISVKAG